MLETIKNYIDSIEDMPFEEYYNQYIMKMEDQSLESEFSYMLSANGSLDILKIDALISKYMNELVRLND